MSFWKKLFGINESRETDIAEKQFAQPSVASPDTISGANIERWKSSNEPETWVRKHLQGWNHQDWLDLLGSLRNSQHWPMEEAAIGQHLELLRDRLRTAEPSLNVPPDRRLHEQIDTAIALHEAQSSTDNPTAVITPLGVPFYFSSESLKRMQQEGIGEINDTTARAVSKMPIVFVSYVKEDAQAVFLIAAALREFGVTVWLDKDLLKPGLRWQEQIRQGISEGDFFLACFSEAYVNREKTYMNEELTLAIEELRLRPTDRAWFIPIKLTQCEVPERSIGAGETLRSIQWTELHSDWKTGMEKLLSVIVPGLERIPELIARLDHQSARKRIEAIQGLGRLGPLAEKALPKLLGRIPIEASSPVGLLPLAAIHSTLVKIGHNDEVSFKSIESVFHKKQVSMADSAMLAKSRNW
jgi:hypothetical protein